MKNNEMDDYIAKLERERDRARIDAVLVTIAFIICSYWATGGH